MVSTTSLQAIAGKNSKTIFTCIIKTHEHFFLN
jgi:hypothetical protein